MIPNPIIVDADVVVSDLLLDADVQSNDLEVEAESSMELRPMPHITIGEVETLGNGEPATATMTGSYAEPVLNLGLPRGERGETGERGPQGQEGQRGIPGRDGTDGVDGFSPIATVTKFGKTSTITITDKNGTTSATVNDGKDGETGATGPAAGFGTLSATVDANVGTPSVTVSDSGPDTAKNISFAFHNIKGQKGDTGDTGSTGPAGKDGVSPTASVSKTGGTATITITDEHGTTTASVSDGTPGAAAGFGTPSVTVDSSVGTPSASVTASGPETAKVFYFEFSNLKGDPGPQGPIGPDYELIEDTRTSNVAAMTGTCSTLTEIKNGTRILFHLNYASAASSTLNLTLADSTKTGAKKVYRQGTTQLAASIGIANCILPLTYLSALDSGNGGWMMDNSYDSNTNTIGYQLRTNSYILKTISRTRYYRLLFTSADNTHWVPANTTYDNSATTVKPVNQVPINPFGEIVYLGNSTSYLADADVTATAIWQQYAFSLGYSFNTTGAALTLTSRKPVYVKCAPQSDGSAIIDSTTPYVQTLPSTADGKIYILLGMAYSATNIELLMNHPVYYFADGAIRIWDNPTSGGGGGAVDSVNGQTGTVVLTASDVGALPDSTVIPTVPTDVSAFNNDAGYLTSAVTSFNGNTGAVTFSESDPIFSASAAAGITSTDITNWNGKSNFSGSYNDLTDKPTIPTVNNATLTIQKNGTTVKTFTANASSNVTADISVPTKVSDLSNDSAFVDAAGAASAAPVQSVNGQTGAVSLSIPTKTSDLVNDSDFIPSSKGDGTIQYYGDTSPYIAYSLSGDNKAYLYQDALDFELWKGFTVNGVVKQSNIVLSNRGAGAPPKVTIKANDGTNTNQIVLTATETTIQNVVAPTADGDAANKKYVDDSVGGISVPTKVSELTNDEGFTSVSFTQSLSSGTKVGTITIDGTGTDIYAPTDTDTKVTQTYATASGYTYWRPLVVGYSSGASESFTPSTVTNTTYTFSTIKCQPSSGTIKATTFKGDLNGTINSDTTATTQATTDNSTKVATTAFVKSVLPTVPTNVSSFTNDAGYLTLSTLPRYNGGVS